MYVRETVGIPAEESNLEMIKRKAQKIWELEKKRGQHGSSYYGRRSLCAGKERKKTEGVG